MTEAVAKGDLFDSGRDPFSPVQIAARDDGDRSSGISWIRIAVVGTPRPQGSKKAFYNAKLGRALVVDDNDAKLRTWRQDVVQTASAARKKEEGSGQTFPLAPRIAIDVSIAFELPRPKGHWRTGRNAHLLRDDAPAFPTTKPDVDKLTRSTLDALRDAGVYVDDSQVVAINVKKIWATKQTGATIDLFWRA